jgi:hypothetical protein
MKVRTMGFEKNFGTINQINIMETNSWLHHKYHYWYPNFGLYFHTSFLLNNGINPLILPYLVVIF